MTAINAPWLQDISRTWKTRKYPAVAAAGLTKLGTGTANPSADFTTFRTSSQQTKIASWMTFMPDNGTFDQAISDIRIISAQQGRTVPLELAWSFPGSTNLAGIAAGNDNAYIRSRAKQLRDYGGPVYARLNWEMNGDWYSWASYSGNTPKAGNTPANFISAWIHTVDLVRSIAPNVAFVWCPHLWVFHSQNPDLWWPGDAWVDWLGVTAYPGSAAWSWIETGDWGLTQFATFATAHGKPMRISEWAPGQGDSVTNVGIFYQFKDWLAAHPVVREIDYFHMTGLNAINYRLAGYPDWQFAYRNEFSAHPERFPQI
jgi:hypothetical protein